MRNLSLSVLFVAACGSEPKTTESGVPTIAECTSETYYEDSDDDGWGKADVSVLACVRPDGFAATPGDCDDADFFVNPDAEELCNDVDDNCDEVADVYLTWFRDDDDDGYGTPGSDVADCFQPDGYVDVDGDCEDDDETIHPGLPDDCDGIDTDCDGVIDQGTIDGWDLMSFDHLFGKVWQIDAGGGQVTEIAALQVTNEVILSVDSRDDGYIVAYNQTGSQLVEIDPCTGAITTIGATGLSDVCAIAFGGADILYGINDVDNTLVSFNVASGTATVIGPLGSDIGECGLAYDCANDVLYGVDATTDRVFQVDVATGAMSNALNTTLPLSLPGLEWDPTLQELHVSSGTTHYALDPTTGTSTLLGAFTAGSSIDDLTFAPACP